MPELVIAFTPMFDDRPTLFGVDGGLFMLLLAITGMAVGVVGLHQAGSDLGPLVRGEARWRYRDHPRVLARLVPVLALAGVVALAIYALWLVVAPVEPVAPRAVPLRLRAIVSVGLAGALLAAGELLRPLVRGRQLLARTPAWWAVHLELGIAFVVTALVAISVIAAGGPGAGLLWEDGLDAGGIRLSPMVSSLGLLAIAAAGTVFGLAWIWRIYRSAELTAPAPWRYRDQG